MKTKTTSLLILVTLCASLVLAGSREIEMELLIRPGLKLKGTERIFIGPVMLEPREGVEAETEEGHTSRLEYAAVREFERYMYKLLHRETRLTITELDERIVPPTPILQELADNTGFWQDLAARTGAEYVVAASIDIKVYDRPGYQPEEFVSDDGKTYYRQVLVEETGFSYDVLLMVFDVNGDRVHDEQITAFKERSERKLDEYTDMYTDIYKLENRLAGIFVPRTVRAKRYLYTD